MKKPRQVLFERHRSAEPKLDSIRQTALASLPETKGQDSHREKAGPGRVAFFPALLFSLRWHFAGIGSLWLIVAFLNMDSSSSWAGLVAKESTPSPQQFLAALRENRRQLLELIEPPKADSTPARAPAIPTRRSELQSANAMA